MTDAPRSTLARWLHPRDLIGLGVAVVSLLVGVRVLEWARNKSDPRRAIVMQLRREATPRDVLVLTDEAPELVAAAAPLAAVWGTGFPMDDLSGVRRVYGIGANPAALATLVGRFGPGRVLSGDARALAWELGPEHTAKVVFDVNTVLGTRLTARREGGADAGDCPFDGGGRLLCRGPDWHQTRIEVHHFEGVELMCLYAHPHPDGRLIYTMTDIPPARAVVGAYGIDDAGYFPGGTDITLDLRWEPEGRPPIRQVLVARNRKGLTPYRFEVPPVRARATLSITTPNAGARQLCLTLRATE